MSTFEIIVTPEMKLEKWLSDMDEFITPLTLIDKEAFNALSHFDSYIMRLDLCTLNKEQLVGDIRNKMLYQYCAIYGQLDVHSQLMSKERKVFLTKVRDTYRTVIERIESIITSNEISTYF